MVTITQKGKTTWYVTVNGCVWKFYSHTKAKKFARSFE